MSCWARLLLEALQDRDEALARQALARGATFEEINEVGDTPLLLACRSGSSNIAKELIQRQANLEARDRRHRFAALHLVSARGDAALVHLLLEQRAEVEVTGREGETPVHLASLMGHAKVLDLLLEASASPNILAIDGKGALSHACYRGHLEVVQSLLLYKAVDRPDAGQRRGLHWAAQHGHEAILDILPPSSINAQDAVGATALSLAAQRGHLEVVRQLVEANAELDLQGCDGETALMLASLNGHLEVVQYLVQANADLMITAKDGFDALRLAAEAEQLEVMQQLLLLGAEVPPEGLLLPQDASCSEDLVLTKSLAKQLLVERAVAGDDALARQWGFNGNGQQLLDAVSRAGCEVPQETDPPGGLFDWDDF